jgi:hypothetical protein
MHIFTRSTVRVEKTECKVILGWPVGMSANLCAQAVPTPIRLVGCLSNLATWIGTNASRLRACMRHISDVDDGF